MATSEETRVLVLDDDEALLRFLRLLLESEGFQVTTSTNGRDGLVKASDVNPDVIILDLEMPVMDGRTFYRELRSQGIETPVIVLSAYGARSAQRELQADLGLDKPFDSDHLVQSLRSLLPASRNHD